MPIPRAASSAANTTNPCPTVMPSEASNNSQAATASSIRLSNLVVSLPPNTSTGNARHNPTPLATPKAPFETSNALITSGQSEPAEPSINPITSNQPEDTTLVTRKRGFGDC